MSLRVWLPLTGTLENKGLMPNTITGTNVTVDANGKIGQCYSFNGSSSYIKLDTAPFDNNTTEMTFACWFKPTITNQTMCLFSNRTEISYAGFAIFMFSGSTKLLFDTGTRLEATLPSKIVVNEWHHLVFTWQRSTGKKEVWVDGVREISSTQTQVPTIANSTNAFIGASQNTSTTVSANYLKGCLNDVRIYDNVLSAAEIKELAKGLVCHYKLDDPGSNMMMSMPDVYNPNNYGAYTISLSENLVAGQTYTLQLWDVDISNTGKTPEQLAPHIYWGGGYVRLVNGAGSFTTGHADYFTSTFTITAEQASGQGATNALIVIYNSPSNVTSTKYMHIRRWKLEKGSVATPWKSSDDNVVIDSSGYGHHGLVINSLLTLGSSRRYNVCKYSADGTSSYITVPSMNFNNDAITINIWFKSTNTTPTNGYHMVVDSIAHRQWYEIAIHNTGYFRGGLFVNGTRYADNCTSKTALDGNWHMLTLSYDGKKVQRYFDSVMEKATSVAKTTGLSSPTGLCIFREGPNAQYACAETSLSDFRIYATALSDSDILSLYNTSAMIDNKGRIHGYEYIEDDEISIDNNGVVNGSEICEFSILDTLKYDPNTYIEPDGSVWVRVFHHNNPVSKLFNSTDDFVNSVYLDEDRWFNFQVCNYVSSYEFMAKVKRTTEDTLKKYRWIQSEPPLSATFALTKTNAITKVTTNGYSEGLFGGIYHYNSSSYLRANDGTEAHFFGALGCYEAWGGGMPGWESKSKDDSIITGFVDVYMRIDNITQTDPTCTKFKKSGAILSHQFIEL